MHKAYQYRPAFFEGFEQEVGEYSTQEELRNIPFIRRFAESGPLFVIRRGKFDTTDFLMCHTKDGNWCVARIDDPVGMPESAEDAADQHRGRKDDE